MPVNTTQFPARSARPQSVTLQNSGAPNYASDDEILGLNPTAAHHPRSGAASDAPSLRPNTAKHNPGEEQGAAKSEADAGNSPNAVSPELAEIFEAHPELHEAWNSAQGYRHVFETPQAAADAKQQLDELDGLFFSNDPADHAALAKRVHQLHPESFHRLARAMHERAANLAHSTNFGSASPASAPTPEGPGTSGAEAVERVGAGFETESGPQQLSFTFPEPGAAPEHEDTSGQAAPARENSKDAHVAGDHSKPAPHNSGRHSSVARAAFFRSTNAATVNQVLNAIEAQLNRLLPESIGEGSRKRLISEIYRELDGAMRANRQLGGQLREAFRSGKGDAAHQQAIVALVTGRAKQALPSIAKRVIGEWTHAVVQGNRERLSRHEKASKRVDIAGAGGSDGVNRKPLSPRDVNYRRLSDSDILNL